MCKPTAHLGHLARHDHNRSLARRRRSMRQAVRAYLRRLRHSFSGSLSALSA